MRIDRSASETALVVKRFDTPERVLVFDQGRLELMTVGGRAIGKGSYAPGWPWSRCATGPASPADALAEHVGMVLSGRVKVQLPDGSEIDLTPGDFFQIAAEYDGWVVGYRPCEILYLSGVDAIVKRVRHME